jgi:O-antigen/teichoic acid export membrane protein
VRQAPSGRSLEQILLVGLAYGSRVDSLRRSFPGHWLSALRSSGRGRSYLRYRGILLGGGLAGVSKAITLLTVAISVPVTVKYLGPDRYGMWMTISSLLAVLTFADLGIGNGLVSAIASSQGRDDSPAVVRLVSSAFYMLVAISIGILLVFASLYSLVSWDRVFAVHNLDAAKEAGPSVLAFVFCFAVGLPFTVVQRLQTGLQESWRSSLWQAGGAVLALSGIVIAVRLHLGVAALVVAVSGGPVLAGVLNTFIEFLSRRPELHPKVANVDFQTMKTLIRSGGIFVALQMCLVVGTGSDSLVIAQIDGASGVSSYSVMYKLFTIATVFTLFVVPLWPALGEALARGDYDWARLAMNRAIALCLGAGILLAILLLLFAQTIIKVWAGAAVVPEMALVGGFAAWILVVAYGGPLCTLLNNKQYLGLQLKYFAFASILALFLKVPLTYWIGPAGVVWATVVTNFLFFCLPAGALVRKILTARK